MRHRFEDSFNMNMLNWKINPKINSIRTWGSRKAESLSKITSFLKLKLEYANYIFPILIFNLPCMILRSISFKFFAKIKRGNYVFCCSSRISFTPRSHLNQEIPEETPSWEVKIFSQISEQLLFLLTAFFLC